MTQEPAEDRLASLQKGLEELGRELDALTDLLASGSVAANDPVAASTLQGVLAEAQAAMGGLSEPPEAASGDQKSKLPAADDVAGPGAETAAEIASQLKAAAAGEPAASPMPDQAALVESLQSAAERLRARVDAVQDSADPGKDPAG